MFDCCEASKSNGTKVIQWEFNGNDNQKWVITKLWCIFWTLFCIKDQALCYCFSAVMLVCRTTSEHTSITLVFTNTSNMFLEAIRSAEAPANLSEWCFLFASCSDNTVISSLNFLYCLISSSNSWSRRPSSEVNSSILDYRMNIFVW